MMRVYYNDEDRNVFWCFAGGKEVDEVDDIFILVAPQNAMGNCIIDVQELRSNIKYTCIFEMGINISFIKSISCWKMQDLRAMTDAAGSRPVILINPRLKVGLLSLEPFLDRHF